MRKLHETDDMRDRLALADLRSLRASDVVYVHVNDARSDMAVEAQIDNIRRLPSATGVIDLKGFLTELRDLGYDGPVTPEPFDRDLAARPPEDACRIAYEHMDKMFKTAGLA